VQPFAARQGRVDERARQVEAPPGGLEHLLDEVAHLRGRQDGRGELGRTAPRDEDLRGRVDPDLLDLRVVEVLLQGPEPGDGVEHRADRARGVAERRHDAQRAAGVVVGEGVGDELVDGRSVAQRVDAATTDQLADLALEDGHAYGAHGRATLPLRSCAPPAQSAARQDG